eukprot:PhM_4_TR17329/c0_g1_i2/m.14474
MYSAAKRHFNHLFILIGTIFVLLIYSIAPESTPATLPGIFSKWENQSSGKTTSQMRQARVLRCFEAFELHNTTPRPQLSALQKLTCVDLIRRSLMHLSREDIKQSNPKANPPLCSGVSMHGQWRAMTRPRQSNKVSWMEVGNQCIRPLLPQWYEIFASSLLPMSSCLSHRSVLFIGNSHLRDLVREVHTFINEVEHSEVVKARRRDESLFASRVMMSIEKRYEQELPNLHGLHNPNVTVTSASLYYRNLNTQLHFNNARLDYKLALSVSAFPQQHDHIFVNHGMWNLLFLDLPTADYLELVMQHFRVIADAFPTTPVTVMNLHYIRVPEHTRKSGARVSVINPMNRVLVAQQCATLERQEVFRAVIECAAARVFKTRRRRRVSMMDFWEMTKD